MKLELESERMVRAMAEVKAARQVYLKALSELNDAIDAEENDLVLVRKKEGES